MERIYGETKMNNNYNHGVSIANVNANEARRQIKTLEERIDELEKRVLQFEARVDSLATKLNK